MTSGEGVTQFKEIISKLDRKELRIMVSLLTSVFRLRIRVGISDDVDAFFYAAILRRFFHIITDSYAFYVQYELCRN